MILTGPEIKRQFLEKAITITNFDDANLGPNSYDMVLGPCLTVYDGEILDAKAKNPTRTFEIPPEGIVLQPGQLYLGATKECACSNRFVPMFEGRSSIGRLGIFTHATAGFGDVGWGYDSTGRCLYPTWTLEISVVRPVRIYAGMRIGQVYFVKPEGALKMYKGKYSAQILPEPSGAYKDREFAG